MLSDLVAHGFYASGLSRRRSVGDLSIATFHRVLPAECARQYPYPGLTVTPEELAWLLEVFTREFTCCTLDAAISRWGHPDAPERPLLALTFDDGQADNYVYARPVLESFGVCASFFVVTEHAQSGRPLPHDRIGYAVTGAAQRQARGVLAELAQMAQIGCAQGADHSVATGDPVAFTRGLVDHAKGLTPIQAESWIEQIEEIAGVGDPPAWDGFMNFEQLAELAQAGHEIGSHTLSHPILPGCDDAQLAREVGESRDLLESRIGVAVPSFCYPNGDSDARTAGAVEAAGYQQAVTTSWGSNPTGVERFQLRRFNMDTRYLRDRTGSLSRARLAWRISRFHAAG